MKVRKPTTHLVEIGPLDAVLKLPTAARTKWSMKTTCARCGKQVTDEYFIAGFKQGHRNMILHEACLDEQAKVLLDTLEG